MGKGYIPLDNVRCQRILSGEGGGRCTGPIKHVHACSTDIFYEWSDGDWEYVRNNFPPPYRVSPVSPYSFSVVLSDGMTEEQKQYQARNEWIAETARSALLAMIRAGSQPSGRAAYNLAKELAGSLEDRDQAPWFEPVVPDEVE